MFAFLVPGVGVISFLTTVDRLISVSIPVRYFKLTVCYAYILGALAFLATVPTYIIAMITSYERRDVFDVSLTYKFYDRLLNW